MQIGGVQWILIQKRLQRHAMLKTYTVDEVFESYDVPTMFSAWINDHYRAFAYLKDIGEGYTEYLFALTNEHQIGLLKLNRLSIKGIFKKSLGYL